MNYNYILLPDGTLKSAWLDRNDTPVLTMDRDTKEIVIPDGVKFIAEDAFRAQQQLESVRFPASIEKIGLHAFHRCDGLRYMHFYRADRTIASGWHNNPYIEVIFHVDDFASVPSKWRGLAKLAYAMDEKDLTSPAGREAAAYVRRSAAKHADLILRDEAVLRHFLREKLISADDYDVFLDAVRERDDFALLAAVLDYRYSAFTPGELDKARERRAGRLARKEAAAIERAETTGVAGLSFCLMCRMTESRLWALSRWLETHGARLTNRINGTTDYVVIDPISDDDEGWAPEFSPRDMRLAKAVGAEIIDEDQLSEMCSWQVDAAHVVLPGWIKSVICNAFQKNKTLETIVIPEGVTHIGENAFACCSNLRSVTLPSTVKSIDFGAFCECPLLTDVNLPEGLQELPDAAFRNCYALESIVLPESLASIGHSAFSGCGRLRSVNVHDGIKSIGSGAFFGCNNLVDADGFVIVRDVLYSFSDMEAASVVIPDGIREIFDRAFEAHPNLTQVVIPDSVQRIGTHAFRGCIGLESIRLPDGLTALGRYAFHNCRRLRSIVIPQGVPKIETCAFLNCAALESAEIPDGVTYISESAFKGCRSLRSITLPPSVQYVGKYAFCDCESLTSAALGADTLIEHYAFEHCPDLTVSAPSGSPAEQFANIYCIPFHAL